MDKKTIRIYKPRFMKMNVEKKGESLFYEWHDKKLKLNYLECQNQVKDLLKIFDFNMDYYLSFVSLSRRKYLQTMKSQNDNPTTNFKIRLIYLQMKEDYERVRTQYILTYFILKTNIVSLDEFTKLSTLPKKTVSQLHSKKTPPYYYETYLKLESANQTIQKEILTTLKKADINKYNKLVSLNIIDFFQHY